MQKNKTYVQLKHFAGLSAVYLVERPVPFQRARERLLSVQSDLGHLGHIRVARKVSLKACVQLADKLNKNALCIVAHIPRQVTLHKRR